MGMPRGAGESREITAALRSLQRQEISFRGPISSPTGHRIVLVGNQILMETEIIELWKQGKLNLDGIGEFLTSLNPSHLDTK